MSMPSGAEKTNFYLLVELPGQKVPRTCARTLRKRNLKK